MSSINESRVYVVNVDLNADIGESYLTQKVGDDDAIVPLLSSASIACGFHGGDPLTLSHALYLAKENGVVVGAHPSFNDRIGFGRRHISISLEQLHSEIIYQLGGLSALAQKTSTSVKYVKAHGALYNTMFTDEDIARTFVIAIGEFDKSLSILGQPQSALEFWTAKLGTRFFREGFADRRYNDDGTLVDRSIDGAVIQSVDEQVQQAVSLASQGSVRSVLGRQIPMPIDSICVHGDTPDASKSTDAICREFKRLGIEVEPFC